jgi:hypothetical protein
MWRLIGAIVAVSATNCTLAQYSSSSAMNVLPIRTFWGESRLPWYGSKCFYCLIARYR